MSNGELRHHCCTVVAFLDGRSELNTTDRRNLRLAQRFFAEHPVDEDDPVTADRVVACGVDLIGGTGNYQHARIRTKLSLLGTENGVEVFLEMMFRENGQLCECVSLAVEEEDGDDGLHGESYELNVPTPKTMREFRTLCSALGIELKEAE